MPLERLVSIDDQASANLRYIRQTMERAGSFTAVPGWGGVMMGASALFAAGYASTMRTPELWFAVWLGEAAIAFVIGFCTMVRKAKTVRVFLNGPGRAFVLSLCPAMAAGVVLTVVLYRQGMFSVLPGLWMLLYGVAVVAGGTNSVRVVPVMGVSFMVLGVVALMLGSAWANVSMAAAFGVLHVVFGGVIARRYGG
jgi:hypothetical protein